MSGNNSKLKKNPSGYEYRKRKAEIEYKFEYSKKFMTIDKYVVKKNQDEGTEDLEELSASSSLDPNILIEPAEPVEVFGYKNAPVQIHEQEILRNEAIEVHDRKSKDKQFKDKTQETLNLYDCGTWPVLRSSNRGGEQLYTNNMAFRGNADTLYTPNNGKFLGLVQLFAKYDPVMQDHSTRAMKGDISDHYCGKMIENELIDLMAEKVNFEIISRAKLAIY